MPEFNISESKQNLINILVERLPNLRKKCRISQADLAKK